MLIPALVVNAVVKMHDLENSPGAMLNMQAKVKGAGRAQADFLLFKLVNHFQNGGSVSC